MGLPRVQMRPFAHDICRALIIQGQKYIKNRRKIAGNATLWLYLLSKYVMFSYPFRDPFC